MTRRLLQLAPWLVLAVAFLATAYLLISTTFMLYDDEGYVLLSLQNFLSGGRLYDEIFSQYGPWPYVYHQLVTGLTGEPLTHLLGRFLTAAHWTACALLAGATALRLTRHALTALAAATATFGLLWQMSSEPTHPGSLIALLVAIAVFAATRLGEGARPHGPVAVIGSIIALLALTKINVGLLLLAGAGAAAMRFTAWPGRWAATADALAAGGLLLVPWALMAKRLDDPWALIFAIQFTAGAGALHWVIAPNTTGRPWRTAPWGVAALAAGLTGLAVCATVMLQGTSLRALVDTVLINPLKHPARFMFGFTWITAIWPLSVLAWLLAARAGWELRRRGDLSRWTRRAVIAARLAALGMFLWHCQTWLTIYGVGRFIVVCLPLLPLFVIPLCAGAAVKEAWTARAATALVAVPQVLHAFPVAGSQMGWGTFALVPIFAAGLHDLVRLAAGAWPRFGPKLAAAGLAVAAAATGWQLWLLAENGWERYHTSRPLGLPGAEDIRIDGPARQTLRVLTLNAGIHADMLFSRPGMFSYNIWSGVPTPTARNATHWFWLLDDPAQTEIIARLKATPRSAVIVNHQLDEFLSSIGVPLAGPLQSHLAANYRTLFAAGYQAIVGKSAFSFLVPRDSTAVAFGKVELLGKEQPEPDGGEPVLLRSHVAIDGQPAGVRLVGASYPWPLREDYGGGAARVFLEPINTSGQTLGDAIPLPATRPLTGLFRLKIYVAAAPHLGRLHDTVLVVTDPAGQPLAEAVF